MYCGSWKIDDLLTFTVVTHNATTGALTDADAVPAYRVYEDETGTAILTGNMAKLDDAGTTGFYSEQITLSAANGLEKGKSYNIYISAAVNSVTGATIRTFQIEAEVDANTVSGTVTPASGSITAAVIADGAIDAATFASGAITATVIADGAIDAATFATGAITAAAIAADAIGASELATDAVNEIQSGLATAAALMTVDGVVDAIKLVTDALPDSGALSSIATASALSTVDTNVSAIQAVTDNLPDSGALTSIAQEASLITASDAASAVAAQAVTACTAVPAANASIGVVLGYILAELRNLKTVNRTTGVETLKQDDGSTTIGTRTVTDDGTTFTRPELA